MRLLGLSRPCPLGYHPASAEPLGFAVFSEIALPPLGSALAIPRFIINHTTLVDGYLGMSNDEERSEMRYVVRIAEFSESSKL